MPNMALRTESVLDRHLPAPTNLKRTAEVHIIGQTAPHVCDPDTYHIDYDFTDWPRWRVKTDVSGPRKDYTIRSLYSAKDVSI